MTPSVNSPAVIDASGNYIVTITTAATAESLAVNGAGVDVQDETGGSLTLGGALNVNGGSFSLIGGSFSASLIDVGNSGSFIGYGTVSGAVAVTGGIEASGGTLDFAGAVTVASAAAFIIENGATLEFDSSVATGAIATFAGTTGMLDVRQPANFNAEVSGISASGDVLDLGGFTGSQSSDLFTTSATYNSVTNTTLLTVADTSQPTDPPETVTLVGNYSSSNNVGWTAVSDGSGGADVTIRAPVTASFNPNYLAFSNNGQSAIGSSPSTQTSDVTIEGWVNWNGTTTPGENQILFYNGKYDSVGSYNGFGVIGVPVGNQLEVWGIAGGETGLQTNDLLSPNQWYFISLTQTNGAYHLYVDGVEQTLLSNTSLAMNTPNGDMLIGADQDNGQTFHGSIADVSLWNAALGQSQIAATEFASLSGSEANLAGYWPLSDGSGTTATDLVNSAGDLTLSGGPTWVASGGNSWLANGVSTGENTALAFTSLSVSDPDAGSYSITVTLDVSHGELTIGSTAGLSVEGLGSDAVSLTGSLAAIDAALASGLTYTPASNYFGADNLTFFGQ